MFACGDSGVWVAPFFEKLAHFLTFVVKVGVVTTKAPQSKKLREWNGIFYVLWMRGLFITIYYLLWTLITIYYIRPLIHNK